jgi:3-oxoacyl-[acyl-carrier protein] reductase
MVHTEVAPSEHTEEHGPVEQRVAVVTGSTVGIGLATAVRLARSGAAVVLNSRSSAGAEAALARVREQAPGANVRHVAGDVTSLEAVGKIAEETVMELGRLDVWVNNAAPQIHIDFFDRQEPAQWHHVMDAMFYSTLNGIHAALPRLKATGGGTIVNVVSDAARVGTAGESLVSAAYGGVISITKSLAREFARYQVRVNCVSITLTAETAGYDRLMAQPTSAKIFKNIEAKMPLGVLQPDDVAQAVEFFACSRRVTGQTLSVNSGLSFP